MERASRLFLTTLLILVAGAIASAQTSEDANYEVYSWERGGTSLGYLAAGLELKGMNGTNTADFKGGMFASSYTIGEVGSVVIGTQHEIRFAFQGWFRFGAAVGQAEFTEPLPPYEALDEKLYLATIDFFSVDFMPSYAFVFSEGNAIQARLGLSFFNVGGTVIAPGKGKIIEKSIAYASIVPMAISASVVYDFGRSGLGIEFYTNPSSFISYAYVPSALTAYNEKGIRFWDPMVKRTVIAVKLTF